MAIIVKIVPIIVLEVIFSSKNIAPIISAVAGTKKIKDETSFAPSFEAPIK